MTRSPDSMNGRLGRVVNNRADARLLAAAAAVGALGLSMLVRRAVVWPRTGVNNVPEWMTLALAAGLSIAVIAQRRHPASQRHTALRDWSPAVLVAYAVFLVSLVPAIIWRATEPAASVTVLVRSAIGLCVVCAVSLTMTRAEAIRLVRTIAWTVVGIAAVDRVVDQMVSGVALAGQRPWYFADGSRLLTLNASDLGIVGVVIAALVLLDRHGRRFDRADVAQLAAGWLLVLTQLHRAGLVAMVALALIAWPQLPRDGRRPLAACWGVIIAGSQLLSWDLRLVRSEAVDSLEFASPRRTLWDAVPDVFADSPLIGWGVHSGVQHQLRPLLGDDVQAHLRRIHNTWLDVAVSGGALGLLFWSAFVAAMATVAVRSWRDGSRFAAGFLAVYVVQSLVLSIDQLSWTWLLAVLLIAASTSREVALGDG